MSELKRRMMFRKAHQYDDRVDMVLVVETYNTAGCQPVPPVRIQDAETVLDP